MTSIVSTPLWCDCDSLPSATTQRILTPFNPTMVRLRHEPCTLRESGKFRFQSHYGAIATFLARVLEMTIAPFQSHYGAIATTPSQSMRPSPALYISIPLWCDCDAAEHLSGVGRGSFNPTMVRLRPVRGRGGHRNHRVSIPLWCDCDSLPKVARRRALKFQSHYGAIATSS